MPGTPHITKEYRAAAADALEMAQRNLQAADRSAGAGELRLASADLVAALEEAAKARIYFAAHEQLLTFDQKGAKTLPYVPRKWLTTDHRGKFALLCCLAIAQLCGQFSMDLMSNESQGWREQLDSDPKRFLQTTYPELTAIFDLSGKFEGLRQGRYSGLTTHGKPIPVLARSDYDRLRTGVGRIVQIAVAEQGHLPLGVEESESLRKLMRPILQDTLRHFRDQKIWED